MAKRRDMMIAKSKAMARLGPDKDHAVKRIIALTISIGSQEEVAGRYVTNIEGFARIAGRPDVQARKMICDVPPGSAVEVEMVKVKDVIARMCDSFLRSDEPVIAQDEPEKEPEPEPLPGEKIPEVEDCPHCKAPVVPKIIQRGVTAGRKRCPHCNELMDAEPAPAEEVKTDG